MNIKHSIDEKTGLRSVEIADLSFTPWVEPQPEVPLVYTCRAVVAENEHSWDDAGREGVRLDVTIIDLCRSDGREVVGASAENAMIDAAHKKGVYLLRGINPTREFEADLYDVAAYLCNLYNALDDSIERLGTKVTRESFADSVVRLAAAFGENDAHSAAVLLNDECARIAGEQSWRGFGYENWNMRAGGWSYSLIKDALVDAGMGDVNDGLYDDE